MRSRQKGGSEKRQSGELAAWVRWLGSHKQDGGVRSYRGGLEVCLLVRSHLLAPPPNDLLFSRRAAGLVAGGGGGRRAWRSPVGLAGPPPRPSVLPEIATVSLLPDLPSTRLGTAPCV